MDRIEPLFLRPVEAAHLLGISRSRIYEPLNGGSLPAIRLDGRTWRIPRAALEKLEREAMDQSEAK
jgi:excisionase family DNA binding protein